MKNKGQVSLEYMTMLGLSLMIFIAVLYVATFLISTSEVQIDVDTAYRSVQTMGESADFIYVHGYPSKVPATVRIPSNVEDLSIQGNVARVRLIVGDSFTDVYSVTKSDMDGSVVTADICPGGICREGQHVLIFEANDPLTAPAYQVNVSVG